ncbi:cytidine/deoxycytidylate deaminase family protein [Streptomyces violascens]|uniref:hypothetical protein n=1 Tax=Streptomyces violascens TaxID=67381 RepID=UPI0036CC42F5
MPLLDQAIRQAMRSKCRYRIGAVLATGNRVLTFGPNTSRNSPTVDFLNATYHAEENALRRARRTKGTVIYVARVNALGKPMLAAPCPRCVRALTLAGVRKAVYTTSEGPPGTLSLAKAPTYTLCRPQRF